MDRARVECFGILNVTGSRIACKERHGGFDTTENVVEGAKRTGRTPDRADSRPALSVEESRAIP
jgi:hypothetical protein